MKARKKPLEIEYFKTGTWITADDAIRFCEGKAFVNKHDHQLYIRTLEGNMHVAIGDYIIKGVKGEFYPCKPDIFDLTYDIVDL